MKPNIFQTDKATPFWKDCFKYANPELFMEEVAERCGWGYRPLWNKLTKHPKNLTVAEAIKIARAAEIPADMFYYYLHKHYYGLSESKPVDGIAW